MKISDQLLIELESAHVRSDDGVEKTYSIKEEPNIFRANHFVCTEVNLIPSLQLIQVKRTDKNELFPIHKVIRMTEKQ